MISEIESAKNNKTIQREEIDPSDFKKLHIQTSFKWEMKFKLYSFFASIITSQKIFTSLFNKIKNFLQQIDIEIKESEITKSYLKKANKDLQVDNDFKSGFGYLSPAHELNVAIKYGSEIENPKFDNLASESHVLYRNIENDLSKLIKSNSNIKSFVNFGVSNGHVDNVMAKKFPHIQFYGVDRSSLVKAYNEHLFSKTTNLHFIADDIFNFYEKQNLENSILFTARTFVLLPREFVQRLLETALKKGAQFVVGYEQFGISRQLKNNYEFSYEKKDSVVYRSKMFIHNYPNLLLESGFSLTSIKSIKTNHPHEDYRILSYLAQNATFSNKSNIKSLIDH